MELRPLLAMAVIAETRSFRLAAEAFHTTQPTITRLISQLEAELETALFRRGWSGTETTAAGETVYSHALHIREALASTEARLGQNTGKLAQISLAQLAVVRAICVHGGASAAAQALGRSQPAISRVLTDIQHLLGLTLFARTREGLSAQPDAVLLAELLGRIMEIVEKIRINIARLSGRMAGRIALGILPFSAQTIVSRTLAEIGNRHPDARLVLVPGTYQGLVDALRRGQIDGLLGVLRGKDCPVDLTEIPLFAERFTVVARADHPVHATARTLADLRAQSWIVPPHGSPVRRYFERVFNDLDNPPRIQTCEIQFFSAAEDMLIDSQSIGIQTYHPAMLRRMSATLRRVEADLPEAETQVGLTTWKHMSPDLLFDEFKRLISTYARAMG